MPRADARKDPRPRPEPEPEPGLVTVAVLNYNGKAHLDECLATLLRQDHAGPVEVLLWDNGSGDGSVEHVRARFPAVRVVASPANLGFAGGMNGAVRAARGKLVVLLNNDIRVEPGFLRELLAVARRRPDAFAIGCRLLLYDRPELVNHAGGLFAPIGGGWDEGFGRPEAGFAARGDAYETGIASGGAMLVRRDAFLALGGFDDRFFMYFEDVDLCLRAWREGLPVVHAARAKVFHKFGGTAGGFASPLRVYWGQRNRLRIVWRSYPARELAWALALLGAWTALSLAALARQPKAMAALARGTLHGLRDRREYRAEYRAHRGAARAAVARLRQAGFWGTARQAWRARSDARKGLRG